MTLSCFAFSHRSAVCPVRNRVCWSTEKQTCLGVGFWACTAPNNFWTNEWHIFDTFPETFWGIHSLTSKLISQDFHANVIGSYRNNAKDISGSPIDFQWNIEAARFGMRLPISLKFDSSAVEMHVKFHSDMIIITSNLAALRLHRDLAVERTSYRLVNEYRCVSSQPDPKLHDIAYNTGITNGRTSSRLWTHVNRCTISGPMAAGFNKFIFFTDTWFLIWETHYMQPCLIQWNLYVTTTSIIKYITCDLFNVF